ncbi:MAG TPA: alpha/beta hydrolase [Stellaceae bacterium]|nr:alpha/beta hydrolase [Stellaceae bacterium]
MSASHYFTLRDGARLHYLDEGAGRPIVLLHGVWGSTRFFHKQIAPLAAAHRVLALDFRGHGRSAMTLDRQTVEAYAEDLYEFIEGLGLVDPVLVGWSMGAFVIWTYGQRFGTEGIAGTVLVDQAPTDMKSEANPGGIVTVDDLAAWHRAVLMDQKAFTRNVVPMMFHRPLAPEDFDWALAEMTAAPPAVAAAIFVDQCFQDFHETARGWKVPTLVCAGERSLQPLEKMRWIAEVARSGEFRVFPDCGHCVFLEEPDLFNRTIIEFVARLPGGAR